MSIQRYRRKGPSASQLARFVPAAATDVTGGSEFIDVDLSNDTFKPELDAFMESIGFTFRTTNPTDLDPDIALQWQPPVIDDSLTTPPGSPIAGDRYLLSAGASGAWAGQDLNIAVFDGSAWKFQPTSNGYFVYVLASSTLRRRDASKWTTSPRNDAISVYDQIGGQNFTGTITVAFDTIQKNTNTAKFTTPVAGIIQVDAAGTFKISFDISGDVTGSSRTTMKTWLEVNAVEVPGTSAYSYHRNATNGEDTASMTTVIDVVAGDQLRVRAQRFAGTGTTLTVLGGSRLTIEQIG